MTEIDTVKFKEKLEEELSTLEVELKTVGRINPDNPDDWEPIPGDIKSGGADKNEGADSIEQFRENTEILKELEIRYNNIKLALKKIEEGTYGICEVCGDQIELDRLEANPAARTNKEHINEEPNLQ